jgi:osmotically inducible protein OsmC
MKREATAIWKGTVKDGSGELSTQSDTLNKVKYSWSSRFAEGSGTNPEELIAAAHATCFTIKLSQVLTDAGFKPDNIETVCNISLENGIITNSDLLVKARIPGISKEFFDNATEDAKLHCPVSKALNIEINLETMLQGEGMR